MLLIMFESICTRIQQLSVWTRVHYRAGQFLNQGHTYNSFTLICSMPCQKKSAVLFKVIGYNFYVT